MRRHRLGRRQSQSMFTRNATRQHPKNLMGMPMRGGIRL